MLHYNAPISSVCRVVSITLSQTLHLYNINTAYSTFRQTSRSAGVHYQSQIISNRTTSDFKHYNSHNHQDIKQQLKNAFLMSCTPQFKSSDVTRSNMGLCWWISAITVAGLA